MKIMALRSQVQVLPGPLPAWFNLSQGQVPTRDRGLSKSWVIEQRRRVDIDSLLKFKSVKPWYLSRAEGDSRKGAIYRFAAFIRWREQNGYSTNPDEWIDESLKGNNQTLATQLKTLKEWTESEEFDGSLESTRVKYYQNVRSFYGYNLVPLPPYKLKLRRKDQGVSVNVTATKFLEMARKVCCFSGISTRDRAVILTMVQSGMDASTLAKIFNYVGFPQLVNHFGTEDISRWDESRVPVLIKLMRPKNDYNYYSFLDYDVITCLKNWLNLRQSRFGRIIIHSSLDPNRLPVSDPIFLQKSGLPIRARFVSNMFKKAGIAAGVNIVPEGKMERYKGARRKYPWHSHEVRDTLVTLGRKAGIDIEVVNFFVGHNIDRYGYDKSPWDDPETFKGEYHKLAKHLNIISGREVQIKDDYERRREDDVKLTSSLANKVQILEKQVRHLMMNPPKYRYSAEALDSKLDEKLEEAGMILDHSFDDLGESSES